MLVKSHGGKYGGDKSWLLIKERDEYARTGADAHVVDTEPQSVASGRDLDAIAADPERVWHSNKTVAENVRTGRVARKQVDVSAGKIDRARKAALPAEMAPQLALLVDDAPDGDGRLHDIKYDGEDVHEIGGERRRGCLEGRRGGLALRGAAGRTVRGIARCAALLCIRPS